MADTLRKTTYELASGNLTICADECKDGSDTISIILLFTRYLDGKLFETRLDNDAISGLHPLFLTHR